MDNRVPKPAKNLRHQLRRWLKLVALAVGTTYLLLCFAVGISQRQLLYHPTVLTPPQVDAAARGENLIRWTNAAGQAIGLKRLAPRQPAVGQVLVTYGNGGSAAASAHYADDLQRFADFDVYLLEYPGYEDRPGTPTQDHLFRAADEALQSLATNPPIYLLGESLGSGVAAYLAGTYPDRVRGVVLLAPYNHLSAVAQCHFPCLPVSLLLLDRFPSDDYLSHYHGPVGILIGLADRVVPQRFGRRLYEGYAGPKQLWEFPGADHGDVFDKIPSVWPGLKVLWQIK